MFGLQGDDPLAATRVPAHNLVTVTPAIPKLPDTVSKRSTATPLGMSSASALLSCSRPPASPKVTVPFVTPFTQTRILLPLDTPRTLKLPRKAAGARVTNAIHSPGVVSPLLTTVSPSTLSV